MLNRLDENTCVLAFFAIVLFGFELYALKIHSQYRFDSAIMIFTLGFAYLIRKKIHLHPMHFFLFSTLMVLHNLGVFGFYGKVYLGMEYDFWVHSYFGLVFSWMLIRAHLFNKIFSTPFMYLMVILLVLGFSAAHEIIEYQGAKTFGEGEGFIFFGVGDKDKFDTQKDMQNNLLGGIFGIALHAGYVNVRKKNYRSFFLARQKMF